MTDTNAPVLVTGGSGFLATHIILRLIAGGQRVRASVRTLDREPGVRTALARAGADTGQLTFVQADLTSDFGWSEAVSGCEYVLHVASPFPRQQPKDANDLIIPAREGALRILRQAEQAGVRRVVMTSSFAAIGYSPKPSGLPYDETDWTDPTGDQSPYVKSKAVAERAAWDFAAHSDKLELTVVNPVGIFGPTLDADLSSSVQLVAALLEGKPPVLPRASFAVVDVRDAADLHLLAMVKPQAAGRRFLAAAGQPLSLPEIAAIPRARIGNAGKRIPKREVPDWLVHTAARVMPALGPFTDLLGPPKLMTTDTATKLLGWQPRPAADTIAATAESLLNLKLNRT